MKKLVLTALLLLALSSVAQADEKFTQMDTNNDGSVTWEEFSAFYPNMKKPAFEAVDTNGDQLISHEEWDAFRGEHARMAAPENMGGAKGEGGMPTIHPPVKKQQEEGKPSLVAPK